MRIVIAEDSAVIRAGLAELMSSRGHQVPAAVGDGQALLRAVAEHEPDLVVVDVRMPPTYTDDGLRAALELRRGHPGLPVLVFSQYVETRVADVAEFLAALERLAAGGTVLDPVVVNELLSASRRSDALSRLTGREREVLALMAEGAPIQPSPPAWSSPNGRSRSTSAAFSSNSACPPLMRITAGSWQCSATSAEYPLA